MYLNCHFSQGNVFLTCHFSQVKVVAETRGHAHAAELREALVSKGYPLIWQDEDMGALM